MPTLQKKISRLQARRFLRQHRFLATPRRLRTSCGSCWAISDSSPHCLRQSREPDARSATARERQITIRLALGASRGRMIANFSPKACSLRLLVHFRTVLAFALSRLLVASSARRINQVFFDLGADWRVLAFTTSLAVATTLLFAPLLPSGHSR